MKDDLPAIVTLSSEASGTVEYENHVLANVSDHVQGIIVMTQPYHWHLHPNSDETFLVIGGGLMIEFEHGELQLSSGQMGTVPHGVLHRTRPGHRSVNLTFEAANAATLSSQSTSGLPKLGSWLHTLATRQIR